MMAMPRLLSRLAADRSGASAVELAIAAPVLLIMMMATWDFSRGFSARLDLEEAAGRAAELATAYGTVRTDYSTLRSEAVAAATASGVAGPAATVDNWLECNGVRQAANVQICPNGQTFARYVSVNVTGTYVPLFTVGGLVGGSGFPLNAQATVRIQ
jgi:Flp pilus assembly protein TadG